MYLKKDKHFRQKNQVLSLASADDDAQHKSTLFSGTHVNGIYRI